MSDWKSITRAEFDAAYNQHLPNWWTRMAYKYFSKSTEKKDMKPGRVVFGFLLTTFLIGFFATVLHLPRPIIAIVTWAYMGVLTVLVLSLFAAVFMNNGRLKRVMKILGVNKMEYNQLVDRFYPE